MQAVLAKEKLSEQAFRILREMITNCRFQPGTRLNIEQLARDLDISRTPVWEAVHRLTQEGLLVSIPNRGVFVSDISPEAALEIYAVREVLEGLAARLAAPNICVEALEKMEKSLEEQYAMAKKQDLLGYSKHDFDFHDVVYELSENKFLQELLEIIRSRTRPTSLDFIPLLMDSYEDHGAVFEALKAGDGASAEKRIRLHIRRLIKALKKDKPRKKPKPSNITST
jgi:DNA-binding GntR family transcriptional regulator